MRPLPAAAILVMEVYPSSSRRARAWPPAPRLHRTVSTFCLRTDSSNPHFSRLLPPLFDMALVLRRPSARRARTDKRASTSARRRRSFGSFLGNGRSAAAALSGLFAHFERSFARVRDCERAAQAMDHGGARRRRVRGRPRLRIVTASERHRQPSTDYGAPSSPAASRSPRAPSRAPRAPEEKCALRRRPRASHASERPSLS